MRLFAVVVAMFRVSEYTMRPTLTIGRERKEQYRLPGDLPSSETRIAIYACHTYMHAYMHAYMLVLLTVSNQCMRPAKLDPRTSILPVDRRCPRHYIYAFVRGSIVIMDANHA